MKAVILCGGRGTRLSGETEFRPKPLVEIGGRPILWHIMKIFAHYGVSEFILCLGYKGGMIKEYFLNLEEMSNDFILDTKRNKIYHLSSNDSLDVTITFADTGENNMTGSRVAQIKKYIGGDEDFFLTYGDGVADVDIRALYAYHKKMSKIGTITVVKHVDRFGVVNVSEGMTTNFVEKPESHDVINGGFMVFNSRIFDYLSTDDDCILERTALPKLSSEKQLAAFHHKGYWQCMDNQRDVDLLNKEFRKNASWVVWKNEDIQREQKGDRDFVDNLRPVNVGRDSMITNTGEYVKIVEKDE